MGDWNDPYEQGKRGDVYTGQSSHDYTNYLNGQREKQTQQFWRDQAAANAKQQQANLAAMQAASTRQLTDQISSFAKPAIRAKSTSSSVHSHSTTHSSKAGNTLVGLVVIGVIVWAGISYRNRAWNAVNSMLTSPPDPMTDLDDQVARVHNSEKQNREYMKLRLMLEFQTPSEYYALFGTWGGLKSKGFNNQFDELVELSKKAGTPKVIDEMRRFARQTADYMENPTAYKTIPAGSSIRPTFAADAGSGQK